MKCNHYQRTVAAAVILAAMSGVSIIGCRTFSAAAAGREAQLAVSRGAAALAQSASGVQSMAVQTTLAEKQVQKAIPHSDVKGQAYLEAASDAHAVSLAVGNHVELALADAGRQIGVLQSQMEAVGLQLLQQQERYRQLAGQWYVLWGLRLERLFWTAAITWLLLSVGSMALGLGNPISWIGRLRGVVSAVGQRWIGEAFVK